MALSHSWNSLREHKTVYARLFGAVRVQIPGQREKLWRSNKAAAILGYLSSRAGAPVSRSDIVDRFWPDSEPKQARQSLRQLLYELRGMLEPPGHERAVIQSDSSHIWIEPGSLSTDVQEFDRCLEQSRAVDGDQRVIFLQSATDTFGGPFLESVDEPWALHERSRYDNRYCSAVCELTDALCDRGESATAVDVVQRALRFLPLRQDLHISAIRAYAKAGETNEAIRQFETLEKALMDELGEEPSQEARDALQNLPGAVKSVKKASVASAPAEAQRPHFTGFPRFIGSPFVGRDDDLENVATMLSLGNDGPRVVTITGPVGTGKTRLAAEVAEALCPEYAGRTFVVAVTEHVTETSFWLSLGSALRPDVVLHDNVKATVLTWLGSEPVLLFIDDCDWIHGSVADLAQDLLREVPALRLLLTSRSPIGLENEQVYRIGPLPLPIGHESLRELLDVPSVRLFWEAARRIEFSFQLTHKNCEAVSKLCEELDGLPLSIVLAAGRISVFRPQQMLERVRDQKAFLKKREKTGPAHHASLEAAMAWTFGSLSKEAQQTLPLLSVFRSGFSPEAVEHVAGSIEVLPVLEELVSASWLQMHESQDEARFGLLNSISTFAASLADDEAKQDWSEKHANYYSTWILGQSKQLANTESRNVSDRILVEVSNLSQAAAFGLSAKSKRHTTVQILDSLRPFFELRGRTGDFLGVSRSLVESQQKNNDPGVVRGLFATGMIAFFQREFQLMETAYLLAADWISDPPSDKELAAGVFNGLGLSAKIKGELEQAAAHFLTAANFADESTPANLRCKTIFNLAITVEALSGFDAAFEHFVKAKDIAEQGGLHKMLSVCVSALVRPRSLEKPSPTQVAEQRRALNTLNQIGDDRASMYVAANLGFACYLAGNVTEAVALIDRAIKFDLQDKEWRSLRSNLAVLALILAECEQPIGSKLALEAHAELQAQIGEPLLPIEQQVLDRVAQIGVKTDSARASRFGGAADFELESIVHQAIDDSLRLASRTA